MIKKILLVALAFFSMLNLACGDSFQDWGHVSQPYYRLPGVEPHLLHRLYSIQVLNNSSVFGSSGFELYFLIPIAWQYHIGPIKNNFFSLENLYGFSASTPANTKTSIKLQIQVDRLVPHYFFEKTKEKNLQKILLTNLGHSTLQSSVTVYARDGEIPFNTPIASGKEFISEPFSGNRSPNFLPFNNSTASRKEFVEVPFPGNGSRNFLRIFFVTRSDHTSQNGVSWFSMVGDHAVIINIYSTKLSHAQLNAFLKKSIWIQNCCANMP